ncbi:hypothetical protein [Halorarius litoreus]|uniref:hypothetical protein n=1 Tax=Halorarius litoreus TaxID=2962676 RepID=UPI0020CD6C10|nr:hypothetical protein [Halorarius litoreus]
MRVSGSRLRALGPPEVYLLALVPALLWGLTPVLEKRGMDGGGNALQAPLVVGVALVVVSTAGGAGV